MTQKNIFNLIYMTLNELYCGDYNKAKKSIKQVDDFKKLDLLTDQFNLSISLEKPKKIKDIKDNINSFNKNNVLIESHMLAYYTDSLSEFSIAAIVSTQVELLDSQNKNLNDIEKIINENKIYFLQPTINKLINIFTILLNENTRIHSMPGAQDLLKYIDESDVKFIFKK